MAGRLLTITSILAAQLVGACSGLWGDDELDRYFQRTDRITMSGGDAKEVNAATHMLTPWPPGVQDRRIVADGARMQRALERYRRSARPPDPLPDIGLGGTPIGVGLPPETPGSGPGATPGGAATPPLGPGPGQLTTTTLQGQ